MEEYQINPLGDRAVLVTFRATEKWHIPRFKEELIAVKIPGVIDVVAAFDCVAIYYDPMMLLDRNLPANCMPYEMMQKWVDEVWKSVRSSGMRDEQRSEVQSIPVCYDQQYGIDLRALSKQTGLSVEEIVASHTESEHTVEMIGFSPGFPYLSGLDERLSFPRKKSPRTTVPAGSVALAGMFTGVYSLPTPGGWHIIGRTPITLFDLNKNPPVRLQTGDRVKFYAISYEAFLKGEY